MRSLVLVALLAGAAIPVKAAEAPTATLIGQDPLMRQIRHRMLQPNGGVQSVTWVKAQNGRTEAIALVAGPVAAAPLSGVAAGGAASADALKGLAVDRRLAAERQAAQRAAHGYAGRVRAPVRQLHRIAEHNRWQQ